VIVIGAALFLLLVVAWTLGAVSWWFTH